MTSTPACSLDASVTVTVTGGTPPYTFYLSGPHSYIFPTQNSNVFTVTGVPGGVYNCTVVDNMQIWGYAQTTAGVPFTIGVSSTNDACNTGTGTANVMILSGGAAPFTYLWSNGATTPAISGLLAGNYTVSVTDDNGCFVTSEQDSFSTAIVFNSSPMTFNITTTPSNCSDGTATVTNLTGGTAPYTYVWGTTPPQFGPAATNLPGGTAAAVSITDATGCTTFRNFWINQGPNGLSVGVQETPETCLQANGSATATVSGGVAPYTYLWSNGATTPFVNGLSTGNYQLTATDQNGCPQVAGFSIGRTDPMTLTINGVQPNCQNAGGSVTVAVTGGSAPYTYLWNNGATTATASGLTAGYYSVTVTDANGCYDHVWHQLTVPQNCFGQVWGKVVYDANANCTVDVLDAPFPNRFIDCGGAFGVTDANGNYAVSLLQGSYTIAQPNSPNYFTQNCPVSPNTYAVSNLMPGQSVTNLDFFNIPTGNVNDLSISVNAQSARPTTHQLVWIHWANHGTTPQNAVINYVHDPLMTFYATPGNYSYNSGTRTISLNPGTVFPGQSGAYALAFTIPPLTPLGTSYVEAAEILPVVGDAFPTDNVWTHTGTVIGSFDPNAKSVFPEGVLAPTDSILTYTVQFQNTGNDTAFTVAIRDTIDPSLDIFSLEVLGASHAYTLSADAPNVAIFTFNNIMLPDSNINEPLSHGHIIYRIHIKPNVALGTAIRNRAAIYFDYNAPVMTNTTLNTYGLVGVESGLEQQMGMTLFPNPATDKVSVRLGDEWEGETEVVVRDLSGRLLQRKSLDATDSHTLEFDLDQLAQGVYLIECSNSTTRMVRKLVRQ